MRPIWLQSAAPVNVAKYISSAASARAPGHVHAPTPRPYNDARQSTQQVLLDVCTCMSWPKTLFESSSKLQSMAHTRTSHSACTMLQQRQRIHAVFCGILQSKPIGLQLPSTHHRRERVEFKTRRVQGNIRV